mgnify:CR=1 FL=1
MPISPRGIAYDTLDLTAPWRARGAPIVFVHGIGANRQCWADWIAVLAGGHPIIRHDLRGFAQSADLPMDQPLMDVLIDDVLYTGRSIRAGLDALLSFGRPSAVQLLVLVDRRFERERCPDSGCAPLCPRLGVV